MTTPDQFSLCLAAHMAQVQTLAGKYFPAVEGRAAGWQVSENELIILEGSTYFVTFRPGAFTQAKRGQFNENEWHVLTTLYMRFDEYDGLWPAYRIFRDDILKLPESAPLRLHGIYDQNFTARDEAGFLNDTKSGNPMNMAAQTLDVLIKQRVLIKRAL